MAHLTFIEYLAEYEGSPSMRQPRNKGKKRDKVRGEIVDDWSDKPRAKQGGERQYKGKQYEKNQ